MVTIAVSVFGACVFFTLWLVNLLPKSQQRISARVSDYLDGEQRQGEKTQTKKQRLRSRANTIGFVKRLDDVLRRGEFDISAQDFILRWVLVVLCLSVIFAFSFNFLGAILNVAVAFLGTLFYLRARSSRRTRRFDEGLYQMLTIIANSLRAGHSFNQAINIVVNDMHGPIKEEFERVLHELQVGASLEDALERASARVGSEDFDLIVTGILIQRQIGGNLAEILMEIANTIRDRFRLHREVKALTAQGKMSANIFMVLPIGIGFIMYLINASYISVLFTSPLGWAMIAAGAMMQGIGYFIIRKIIQIDL